MNDTEYEQARKALQRWFTSQDIAPPDAGIIMMDLIAELFVIKTKKLPELQEAIKLFSAGLSISVIDELRKQSA